jgi:hypothetical protein
MPGTVVISVLSGLALGAALLAVLHLLVGSFRAEDPSAADYTAWCELCLCERTGRSVVAWQPYQHCRGVHITSLYSFC